MSVRGTIVHPLVIGLYETPVIAVTAIPSGPAVTVEHSSSGVTNLLWSCVPVGGPRQMSIVHSGYPLTRSATAHPWRNEQLFPKHDAEAGTSSVHPPAVPRPPPPPSPPSLAASRRRTWAGEVQHVFRHHDRHGVRLRCPVHRRGKEEAPWPDH